MTAKLRMFLPTLLFLGWNNINAQSVVDLPRFMGRKVTIVKPEMENEYYPKGPASVCIEGPPQRQCYITPKDFGRDPAVGLLLLKKDMPALLFSAASGGVSGFGIHIALLVPRRGKDLDDLFLSDITISNQSQHAFWNDPTISDTQIFVTADFVWGRNESHYTEHRFIVSAYLLEPSSVLDGLYYYLEDRYMTSTSTTWMQMPTS
jgi:hypothetical protein